MSTDLNLWIFSQQRQCQCFQIPIRDWNTMNGIPRNLHAKQEHVLETAQVLLLCDRKLMTKKKWL